MMAPPIAHGMAVNGAGADAIRAVHTGIVC
jgi:hypothetical protein